jgi:hypothetical protein
LCLVRWASFSESLQSKEIKGVIESLYKDLPEVTGVTAELVFEWLL